MRYKVPRRAGYKQRRKSMKYRDNMTADEQAKLLAEIEKQEAAYAAAGDCSPPIHDEETIAHFDRFIAGDR